VRFDHVGIKSADITRSLDFYTRILGFDLLETIAIGGRNFYFVGNDKTRIEIEEANEGDARIDVNTGFGLYHIALITEDLEKRAAAMKVEQVKFILEPIQLREDRKIAFIEDPDGVRIQLIEFLK